jgi:hypothetical protein
MTSTPDEPEIVEVTSATGETIHVTTAPIGSRYVPVSSLLDNAYVPRDAVAAFAEEMAELKYQEYIGRHNYKTCVELGCGVCRELAVVKAETIPIVLEKVLDKVYDELVEVTASLDPSKCNIDDLARVMKARLSDLRSLDVRELWD